MKKKFINIIQGMVIIFALVSLLTIVVYAETEKYQYQLNEDGYIEITAYTGEEKHVVIPSEIDGIKVVSIGKSAFAENTKIKSVQIPDTITTIRKEAFYKCKNLEQVDIYGDISVLERWEFAKCRDLEIVNFYGDLYSISPGMFMECTNLENIYIPESVSSIGNSAFAYCSELLSIDIPEGVEMIEGGTFYGCGYIRNITLPGTIKYIKNDAFSICVSLTEICIPKSIEFVGVSLFTGCNNIEKMYIHEDISASDRNKLISISSKKKLPNSSIIYYNDEDTAGMVPVDYTLLNAELEKYLSGLGYNEEQYTITEYRKEVNGIWVEVKFAGEEEYLIRIKQTLEGEPYLLYSNAIENTDNKTDDVVISNGDVNSDGFVDATDALLILKHSARLEIMDIEKEDISDINDDGIIDANDALIILQIAANLI